MIGFLKQSIRSGLGRVARATIGASADLAPARWRLAPDRERGLCLEGIALRDLIERWGSPLHVVHAMRLAENVAAIQQPSASGGLRCELFYSCKTNPVPGVLQLLREHGAGIEVTSPFELWLALRAGFRPDEIIYDGPGKSEAALRDAVAQDLLLININHLEEIAVLARVARALGRRPRVGIRVVPPGAWGGQLGVPIAGGHALATYKAAIESDAMDVVAIHAHRGSLIRTGADLESFVNAILNFVDELRASLGLTIEIVDFGGSLAVPTIAPLTSRTRRLSQALGVPPQPPDPSLTLSLREYADGLVAHVRRRSRAPGSPLPRIFVEAGRAVTADTQLLLATVVSLKRGSDRTFAILDAGNSIAEPVQHEYHQVLAVRPGALAPTTYALTGPASTPADAMYPAVRLPELKVGDVIAIMDSGAYFVPFATSFSFPRPAIVLVRDGKDALLRRAETFDDMVSLDT